MQQEHFKFELSKRDHDHMAEIMENLGIAHKNRTDAMMDLTFVHNNVCELDLEDMARHARSHDYHFKTHVFHDLMGIAAHLDRVNGTLEHFRPRFAKKQ